MDDSIKDDAHFVSRALDGDSEAYCMLVEKCTGSVYSAAYRILRHKEDAEDACQEAFTRAYNNLPDLRDPSTFCTWTKRIAVNWSQNMIRKRSTRKEEHPNSLETEVAPVKDPPETNEAKSIVVEGLAHLRSKQREVISLRWLDGLKTHEIANMLKISDRAVRSRMNRGMSNLREWLEANYPQWFHEMT